MRCEAGGSTGLKLGVLCWPFLLAETVLRGELAAVLPVMTVVYRELPSSRYNEHCGDFLLEEVSNLAVVCVSLYQVWPQI